MAHRTENTGSMERVPLRDDIRNNVDGAEGATDGVRQSRRVQGLDPEFPNVTNPGRRMSVGNNGGDGQRLERRGGRDDDLRSVSSKHTSRTVRSNRSEGIRMKLIAELQAQEELDKLEEEIERKMLERKRKLIEKRLAIATLEDDRNSNSSEINVSLEKEMSKEKASSVKEKCQSWLNNQSGQVDAVPVTIPSQVAVEPDAYVRQPKSRFVPEVMTSEVRNRRNWDNSGQNDEILSRIDRMLSRQAIPKDLPHFDGEVSEWPMFITQFLRTTKLLGLSEDENLVRLQKCLKGKAREAVLPIMSIPENVTRIIDTLEVMFGRSELIIKSMIQKVKIADSPKESRPDTIIAFSNLVANLVATMKTLHKIGHMSNPQLMEDLLLKLPHQLRFQWCTWVLDKTMDPSLEDFAIWLEKVALTYSIMPSNYVNDSTNEKADSSHKNVHKKKTVLNIVETDTSCQKCKNSSHKLKNCSEFAKLEIKDRWSFVMENRLCICCFVKGHRLNTPCPNKQECGKDGCKKLHNKLLHKYYGKSDDKTKTVENTSESSFVGCAAVSENDVLLKILPVVLSGPKGDVHTYALIDDGATVTMMDTKIAQQLGVKGPTDPLCIQWTNEMDREESNSQRVKVRIAGKNADAKKYFLNNVRTVENLSLPMQRVDMEKLRQKWSHLIDVNFDSILNQRPMILLGQDNVLLFTPKKLVRGPWCAPVATKTALGWVVHGNVPGEGCYSDAIALVHTCNREDELTQMVKDSFSTESFGVRISAKPMRSMQDERAIQIMEATTRRIDGRFETGLLWKADGMELPESKSTALRRLKCIERRMDKDSAFAETYTAKIEEFVQKGYARGLTDAEAAEEHPRTGYMSHFAVTNPNKPGKVRLVFDLAAKSGGVSLNDCLLKGPDLLNSLPAVLWRFRKNPVAVVGDVKEMFPQIKIIAEDQQAQRFLWRGKNRKEPPTVYMMTSMVFGAACSPSSANWVKIKNAEEFKDDFPRVYEAVMKQTFMDDQLDGGSSDDDVAEHVQNVIEVYSRGGFCICNWVSNSLAVMEKISPEMRGKGFADLTLGAESPVERVLGLRWRTATDEFFFTRKFHKVENDVINGVTIPTKRQVLALTMSIFDPLGFLAPLIIKVRIHFQCIWRSGIGWDDELTTTMFTKWKEWLDLLRHIDEFSIDRCYHPKVSDAVSIQLHVFTDASLEAFACVAYLRIELQDEVHIAFVSSKAKVAPLKPLSVPRMELQAAVLGSRLAQTIKAELNLKISETHFWSDSKTVLSWIRSETCTYKQFVSHRIGEILESTETSNWHWVPTLENVADEATRSEGNCDLSKDSRWLCGPKFLRNPKPMWPKENENIVATQEEIRKDFVFLVSTPTLPNGFSLLPDTTRFSKWNRLLRATAWAYRVCLSRLGLRRDCRKITVEDIAWVKRLWWRKVQSDYFSHEVKTLLRGKVLEPSSKLYGLSVFMDTEGVIRMKGRTSEAMALELETKHPVILHSKHRFTELMVQEFHCNAAHQGKETVANQLRQEYWMTGLRAAVKKAFFNCPICKVKKAKPVAPEMGDLPQAGLTQQIRPFIQVGMDFFGPYRVKIRRAEEKRYGVLFTCLSTRAVHIEVAESLSTDSAINTIRRFVGRRGKPDKMFSDNATNLRGGCRELRKAIKEVDGEKLQDTLSANGINWSFIPPASPHMGGSWERLIRSVKVALNATLGGRLVRLDVLQTLMIEAEHTVNSRPLTYVSVDPGDLESLTPNHFLIGPNGTTGAPGQFKDADFRIRRQWRQSQRLADFFWTRWVKEYLPSLNRRSKWLQQAIPLKVGDIVVIADNHLPRNRWPLGKIVRVFPGKNNQVRVADVKTSDGGVYRRPAVKLCKLNVRKDDEKESFHEGKKMLRRK